MLKSTLFFLLWASSLNFVFGVKNYRCNICGCENCTIADPVGVVNFMYDNKAEKRPCLQLQQEVENPTIYNTTYCKEVIWRAAFEPCLCYNVNAPDVLLSDIDGTYNVRPLARTCIAHTHNSIFRITDYAERPYGNPGTVEYNPEDCEGDDCGDGSQSVSDGDEPGNDGPSKITKSSGAERVHISIAALMGTFVLLGAW